MRSCLFLRFNTTQLKYFCVPPSAYCPNTNTNLNNYFTVENETRCFGELGCLNITREWYHLIHRPFNVFPLPRSVINTRFILYTEKNPTEGQILTADKDSIKNSNFK